MMVGYVRTAGRGTRAERAAVLAAGVEPRNLYADAGPSARSGLTACLAAVGDGDTLVVARLDRLGPDLGGIVNSVLAVTARGAVIRLLTGRGADIGGPAAASQLVAALGRAVAEFESGNGMGVRVPR